MDLDKFINDAFEAGDKLLAKLRLGKEKTRLCLHCHTLNYKEVDYCAVCRINLTTWTDYLCERCRKPIPRHNVFCPDPMCQEHQDTFLYYKDTSEVGAELARREASRFAKQPNITARTLRIRDIGMKIVINTITTPEPHKPDIEVKVLPQAFESHIRITNTQDECVVEDTGAGIPQTMELRITVQKGVHIVLKSVYGAITIGNTEGDLKIIQGHTLYNANIKAASIRNLKLQVEGNHLVTVDNISGSLEGSIGGETEVKIRKGQIKGLKLVKKDQASLEISSRTEICDHVDIHIAPSSTEGNVYLQKGTVTFAKIESFGNCNISILGLKVQNHVVLHQQGHGKIVWTDGGCQDLGITCVMGQVSFSGSIANQINVSEVTEPGRVVVQNSEAQCTQLDVVLEGNTSFIYMGDAQDANLQILGTIGNIIIEGKVHNTPNIIKSGGNIHIQGDYRWGKFAKS